MARPPRQCWHYDPTTGKPLRGFGCPAGSSCPFIHPDSPRWKDASRSVPTAGKRQRSRDHSPASVSFDTSYNSSEQMQDSWGNKRRELSSRLSDPKPATKGLGERLGNSSSSSHGWGSLSSRIQDPQTHPPPYPPTFDKLTSRISDPPPVSGWGAGSSNQGSSSGWGAPGDDISWPEANLGTTKSKSDIVPPRGPRKRSSPAFPPKPPSTQRPEPQKIPITLASLNEPSVVAAPRSPPSRTKQSRSPPPPRPTTQPPPPLISSPIHAPSPKTQPPPLPAAPPPAQSTTQPLPSQALTEQQSRTPAPPSPIRTRPSLSVGVPPLPFDQPPSAVTAATQTPVFQTSRTPDPQLNEVIGRKDTSEFQVAVDRLRTLCRVVVYFMEYREAEYAAQSVRHQRASYKSCHIGEGAQAKIEGGLHEADTRVKDKLKKFEGSLSKFANTNIWPTVVPPDSRLEGFTQQLQDLQKRVEELSEKVKKKDSSSSENSMTVEEIVGQQTDLVECLDRIELHQADVEDRVQQRLEDLSLEQRVTFKDLASKAETAQKEMDLNANLVKDQVLQLAKDQQALGEELAQIYIRQADANHGIEQLQEENEELKKRLAMYEKRDVRLRSELQAASSSLDVLKNQQKLTMQERLDPRLLESTKTTILDQARELIEARFSAVETEVETRMKAVQGVTSKDFDTKYVPALRFLGQLQDHLRKAINEVNRNSTLR